MEENKVDTSVDLCGIKMENPLIVAAGPFGASGGKIKEVTIPRAAPGAVETKVIFTRVLPYFGVHVAPARAWSYSKIGGRTNEKFPTEGYTLMAGGPGITRSVEQWLERDFDIAVEVGKNAGVPIIVNGPSPATDPEILKIFSTSADKEIERMAELAKKFEEKGAAAVQALFHAFHVPGYGWYNWPLMPKIISSLKNSVNIPVIVKLPYHPDIVDIVKRLENLGANAVILTGIGSHLDIDIEAGRPYRPALTGSDTLTGALLKPKAMSSVAMCLGAGIKIPLIASGGAFSARDVISYVMAGATCVHILTAAVLKGLSIFKRINRDITEWLDAHGYKSLDDIRGIAARKWGEQELKALENIRIEVDESRCDGCGICARYCLENVEGAIRIEEEVARIDEDKCHKCTMCALVCPPEKGAISVKGWPL